MARYAAVDSLGSVINSVLWDGVSEFDHPYDTTLIATTTGCRGDTYNGVTFSRYVDGGSQSIAGRTRVTPIITSTTAVIVTLGQSTISSLADGSYTCTHPSQVFNFNFYDGFTYTALNPLIGTAFTSFTNGPNIPIADGLINANKFTQIILVTLSFTNSSRTDEAMRLLLSKGMTPTMILYHYGEAWAAAGTSYETIVTTIRQICSRFRQLGINAPFFVAQESRQIVNGVSTLSNTVRAAQFDSVTTDLNMFHGPDWDTAVPLNERYDQVHFTAAGSLLAAAADVTVIRNHTFT